jgi:hypothetical protein
MKPEIIMNSGQMVNLLDPDPETILIDDIAHNLAKLCRFNGATNRFYSVAEHSLYVSELVGHPHRFAALMHDAAEAYLGDIVTPLKQLLPDFLEIEARMEYTIACKFGLPIAMHPAIKEADRKAYIKERFELISSPMTEEVPIPKTPLPGPTGVRDTFLRKFRILRSQTP